jgi:hypothetical protein
METNPYAPPNSVVADVSVVAPEGIPLFFPVSVFKLLVLLFCTLGMYEYYWFYMNWKLVRDRTHEDISPFLAIILRHLLLLSIVRSDKEGRFRIDCVKAACRPIGHGMDHCDHAMAAIWGILVRDLSCVFRAGSGPGIGQCG